MKTIHPDWQEVLDALENPDASSHSVLEHVERCSSCRDVGRAAREILETLALARSSRPPDALVERVLAAILAEADPWTRIRGYFRSGLRAVRALPATLSPSPASAFRGTAAPHSRMLLYETPHHAVSLSLADSGAKDSVRLRGQVMPRRGESLPTGARALLVTAGDHAECDVSEFGEFAFAAAPRGKLHLAIEIGDERLEMGPFGES